MLFPFWFLKKWENSNILLYCIIAKIFFSLKDLVNMTYVNAVYQDFLDPRKLSAVMQDFAHEVAKHF